MGIFSRKKNELNREAEAALVQSNVGDEGDDLNEVQPRSTVEPGGPWDVTERPDLDNRMDFGALRIPGIDGMKLRLQGDQEGKLGGVTIELDRSTLQLNVFAAPRSEGVWDEVRTELAAKITSDGGTADERSGPFGPEVYAQTPVRVTPQGKTKLTPARFIGIDGPRWFIRAVITGKGAVDAKAAAALETVLANVVVVRGDQARPPREVLYLTPPNVVATKPQTPAEPNSQDFNPLKRGPEIAEIR